MSWLYYSLFSLLWFLAGFLARQTAYIAMKLPGAGTMARLIRAGTARGTAATTEVFNSPFTLGEVLEDWDFPLTPPYASRNSERSACISAMGIRGENGRVPESLAV